MLFASRLLLDPLLGETVPLLFFTLAVAPSAIRDDKRNWHEIESYISEHSQTKFSQGMCPDCGKQYYGEL